MFDSLGGEELLAGLHAHASRYVFDDNQLAVMFHRIRHQALDKLSDTLPSPIDIPAVADAVDEDRLLPMQHLIDDAIVALTQLV
jgi:hypothetical protein